MPWWPLKMLLANPLAGNGYVMNFVEEKTFTRDIDVQNRSHSNFECNLTVKTQTIEAYYLSGLRVKASKGPLREGKLRVWVDGEEVLNEDVAKITLEKMPWVKKSKWGRCIFTAVPFAGGRIGNALMGFFLPNGTVIKVVLKLEAILPRPIKLEILGAMYETVSKADGGHEPLTLPAGVADL